MFRVAARQRHVQAHDVAAARAGSRQGLTASRESPRPDGRPPAAGRRLRRSCRGRAPSRRSLVRSTRSPRVPGACPRFRDPSAPCGATRQPRPGWLQTRRDAAAPASAVITYSATETIVGTRGRAHGHAPRTRRRSTSMLSRPDPEPADHRAAGRAASSSAAAHLRAVAHDQRPRACATAAVRGRAVPIHQSRDRRARRRPGERLAHGRPRP